MNDIRSQPGQKRVTWQSWEVERRRYTHHQFCWPPQCMESLGGILSAPCTSCLSSCRWLSAAHQTPSKKEPAIMGPTAGQVLISPLQQAQVQNPEFSQEGSNKGNWPLLERKKEKKGEYPACSQPVSLHDAQNSPSFSFTFLFCTTTSTLSPMTVNKHWERSVLINRVRCEASLC